MRVLFGLIFLFAAVLGGFLFLGGHPRALFQLEELLIIGGAALGAFVVANPRQVIWAVATTIPSLWQTHHFSHKRHLELLLMLYMVLVKVRREGLISIEKDVDQPLSSALFSQFPSLQRHFPLMDFLTDYLRLIAAGNLNVVEIEQLMELELDSRREEGEIPVHALTRVADALPAFGVVAAVLGVVHTMESVGLPPAQLGQLIAAALVGTFLGVLLSYGLVAPLAVAANHRLTNELKALECVKVTLLSSMSGYAPQVAVEFGRKVLFVHERPSFLELEEELRRRKSEKIATKTNNPSPAPLT